MTRATSAAIRKGWESLGSSAAFEAAELAEGAAVVTLLKMPGGGSTAAMNLTSILLLPPESRSQDEVAAGD